MQKQMNRRHVRYCCLLLSAYMLLQSGCALTQIPLFNPHSIPVADAKNPAVEIVTLWQPAEGRDMDNLPSRGFAGQIMFFSHKRKEPVKVEGDVRIYLFDDLGSEDSQTKPIHQFDFDAGSWNTYLRETNLGATYQLFIPYTRKGSHQAHCSLRVRFTPQEGQPVYSDMASITLLGTKKQADAAARTTAKEDEKSNKAVLTGLTRKLQAAVKVKSVPNETRISDEEREQIAARFLDRSEQKGKSSSETTIETKSALQEIDVSDEQATFSTTDEPRSKRYQLQAN